MATKKPAVSTLLKAANARIEALEKEVRSQESKYKYAQEGRTAAENELAQVHAFLDTLPGLPPETDKETYKKHSAMTRLAAWLAMKAN